MAKNIVSLLYNRQVCVYPRVSFACTFRPSQIQLGMRLGRKFDWVGGVFRTREICFLIILQI